MKRTAFTLLILVTRSVHPEREIIYQSIFLPLFHSVFYGYPIENGGYITWRLYLIFNLNNLGSILTFDSTYRVIFLET